MPDTRRMGSWLPLLLFMLAAACAHSDSLTTPSIANGPRGTGPEVQLTLNPNQDYWPIWTEDGQGILYSFIPNIGGVRSRCIGLLPPAGGTRLWELCDNRLTQADSVSSFAAYALGNDGRLLYAEAISGAAVASLTPDHLVLWLADSAHPFHRRALLTLPILTATVPLSWLADIRWTGPATFLMLGQSLVPVRECNACGGFDSTWTGLAVYRGAITAAGATIEAVPGTEGANGYSLAENGSSIVFTVLHQPTLFKVPVAGGTPQTLAIVSQSELLGVSCRNTTCVVADDPLLLAGLGTPPALLSGNHELRAVSLVSGVVQVVRSDTETLVATPQISPNNGDVVAQIGGAFGHLQSLNSIGSDLHLFQGLVP